MHLRSNMLVPKLSAQLAFFFLSTKKTGLGSPRLGKFCEQTARHDAKLGRQARALDHAAGHRIEKSKVKASYFKRQTAHPHLGRIGEPLRTRVPTGPGSKKGISCMSWSISTPSYMHSSSHCGLFLFLSSFSYS